MMCLCRSTGLICAHKKFQNYTNSHTNTDTYYIFIAPNKKIIISVSALNNVFDLSAMNLCPSLRIHIRICIVCVLWSVFASYIEALSFDLLVLLFFVNSSLCLFRSVFTRAGMANTKAGYFVLRKSMHAPSLPPRICALNSIMKVNWTRQSRRIKRKVIARWKQRNKKRTMLRGSEKNIHNMVVWIERKKVHETTRNRMARTYKTYKSTSAWVCWGAAAMGNANIDQMKINIWKTKKKQQQPDPNENKKNKNGKSHVFC